MFNRNRTASTIDGVDYAPERQFRVIKAGARLSGWKSTGNSSWRGWGQQLQVGDILTCTGFGPGFGSDPGFGVEWTSELARSEGVGSLEFEPSKGGIWNYHPAAGYLEPVQPREDS